MIVTKALAILYICLQSILIEKKIKGSNSNTYVAHITNNCLNLLYLLLALFTSKQQTILFKRVTAYPNHKQVCMKNETQVEIV